MNEEAVRIALREPAAWECLTDRQAEAMRLFIENPNVTQIANELDTSRQAVQKSLRLAKQKFRDFARTIAESNHDFSGGK